MSRNPVNRQIARTIRGQDTNEFALFNNGITMISDETGIQLSVGQLNRGQLYLKNPQIINGGQTAYTLSKIYEDVLANGEDPEKVFGTKEVMLKVITFPYKEDSSNNVSTLDLIADISRATNSQTSVQEADGRANDRAQIEIQQRIFNEFGYFYERKRGEFFDGLAQGYVSRDKVIDRQDFARVCYAIRGKPSEARRTGQNALFRKQRFYSIFSDLDQLPKMFFAFMCFKRLDAMRTALQGEPNNRYGIVHYGNVLEHGILAAVFVAHSLVGEEVTAANVESLVENIVPLVLSQWLEFEEFVKIQEHNRDYFRRVQDLVTGVETVEAEFSRYYRGRTLNNDLVNFFKIDIPVPAKQ